MRKRKKQRLTFACHPGFLFKIIKGIRCFQVPAGRGDSAALRETTRRRSCHGAGRRPQAFRLSLRKRFWFRRGRLRSRPVPSRIAPPSPRPVQASALRQNTIKETSSLSPELGDEKNQEGVDLQPAAEHAEGQNPLAGRVEMGEIIHGAHFRETGPRVAQGRGHGGNGG